MYHLDNTSGVPEMPEPKDEQSINPRWFGESQEQGGSVGRGQTGLILSRRSYCRYWIWLTPALTKRNSTR
ncbi:Uncharacterised protein [Klebsiella pneumoniae]|nr:Uncharacterised protein [Klebsiella pneumoniae]